MPDIDQNSFNPRGYSTISCLKNQRRSEHFGGNAAVKERHRLAHVSLAPKFKKKKKGEEEDVMYIFVIFLVSHGNGEKLEETSSTS